MVANITWWRCSVWNVKTEGEMDQKTREDEATAPCRSTDVFNDYPFRLVQSVSWTFLNYIQRLYSTNERKF